jgi:hypothetical protein
LRFAIRELKTQIYDKQTRINAKLSVIQLTQESIAKLEKLVIKYKQESENYVFCQTEIDKKNVFITDETARNSLIPKL